MLRYPEWDTVPICFLDSSVFIVRRYADTATLPQSQDRTPASASVPAPAFIFFPAGWKCQPEGEDIGSGCCRGGVIQLRSRERALLRQGQLFEPAASSGPAAMVLAISRNLSCIPRRSPCPGRYPLPLASGFLPESMPHPSGVPTFHSPHGTLAHTDILSLHKSKQKSLAPQDSHSSQSARPISVKLEMRLELTTPSLRVKCSTD